jgi:hypothetical protein
VSSNLTLISINLQTNKKKTNIMSQVNDVMALLDTVYTVYVQNNNDRNKTINDLVNKYGCIKVSVEDTLDVAMLKANKDAKGESCLEEVEALIARHK